ncbi:hypothetical protein OG568_48570 (plasmid) [Streptomyces sp. NBC_01450]|uniref:hypothetical protein n=1 Tax=Streptomyces sp. NBC_01450 TaxID=2903871 RepID=UPI002E3223E7|nr:hypothetical protein [Streptomyces sp. NBC_01450]
MRKRDILEQARWRDSRSGPTAGEIEIIDGFRRGRHAPHLADTRHNLHVRLLRRHSEDIGTPLTEQPVPEAVGREELVPAPCVLRPEEMVEHPYLEALAPSLQARIDAWEGPKDDEGPQYIYDLSTAPGWRIGGYIAWNLTGPQCLACSSQRIGPPSGLSGGRTG